jgi:cytochrome c553
MWMDTQHRLSTRMRVMMMASIAVFLVLVTGCHQDMYNQPRYKKAYMTSDFFADGMASRPRVPGTVSQQTVIEDEHFYTGMVDGEFVTTFPYTMTSSIIRNGRSQYEIFCVPCHGTLGNGKGIVQQRGLTPPASYHTDRLREESVGYLFDVITNGYRNMYPYGSKISPEDRWAIVAYVRALQFSQNATCEDVPDDEDFKEACSQ